MLGSPLLRKKDQRDQERVASKDKGSMILRVKAKLKFLNVHSKQHYEKTLKNFTTRDSIGLYTDDDFKVSKGEMFIS